MTQGTISALFRCPSMVATNYRLWTQEEDRRLLELHAAGRSALSISATLRRSKKAVILRLDNLRAPTRSKPATATPPTISPIIPKTHHW